MALLIASAGFSQAQESRPETRPLSTDQLSSIRAVSRNVLAAKKSGIEDSTDVDQLKKLRATLDQLIASELDPKNRLPITVQGQENGEQRRKRDGVENLRRTARSDASALATNLRQRGERKAAQARDVGGEQMRSAGLPIGEQRAQLFERWSQKLDLALGENIDDRAGELLSLRKQLGSTFGGLTASPTTRGTPTLQAMPSSFVPSNQ
jgi:hypothetical protein